MGQSHSCQNRTRNTQQLSDKWELYMAILDGSQLRTKGLWHACIMKGRYWDLLNISSLPIW